MKLQSSSVLVAVAALTGIARGQFQVGRPPNPMDKAKATLVEDFPWRDPFTPQTEDGFDPTCEATGTFAAEQYTLHQLWDKTPLGLWSWAEGLKKFWKDSEYPGSWSGLDRHGWDRNVLLMSYDRVPLRVREWIEEQDRTGADGTGLFAIFAKPKDKHERVKERILVTEHDPPLDRDDDGNRVVLFAPGALYAVLPLFVAQDSGCADIMSDLSKYSPGPVDGGVVAWPVEHTRPSLREKTRDIEFTVKAQVLQARPERATEAEDQHDEKVKVEL